MLQMVNCGHVPPIIVIDDASHLVEDGDLPVGLMSQAGFHVIEYEFPVKARLCVVTDGISEAENTQGAEFGLASVQQRVGRLGPLSDILGGVQEFSRYMEAQDHRTPLVLARTKVPP